MTVVKEPGERRSALRLLGRLAVAVIAARLVPRPASAAVASGKWVCTEPDCDPYIYDPAVGDPDNIADPDYPIAPGTPFEALPESWLCPYCGGAKHRFIPYHEV